MALVDITTKIIDDARSEAKQILASAEKQKDDIDKQTALLVAEATASAEHKWQNLLTQAEEKQLASKKQEGRKLIEAYKRQALDDVFQQAQKGLDNLAGENRHHLIKKMWQQLPTDWSGQIQVADADAKSIKELTIKQKNIDSISINKELSGGFIASNNSSEYNFSFNHLLAIAKNHQESTIAKILFKQVV